MGTIFKGNEKCEENNNENNIFVVKEKIINENCNYVNLNNTKNEDYSIYFTTNNQNNDGEKNGAMQIKLTMQN